MKKKVITILLWQICSIKNMQVICEEKSDTYIVSVLIRMKGSDVDAWEKHRRRKRHVKGKKIRIYSTTNPLHSLAY